MRNTFFILAGGVTLISCRSNVPPAPPYVPVAPTAINVAPPQLAGPTLMARVADGYELKNDRVRVVIGDKTGDVIFWGTPAGRNLLLQPGIVARLIGQPESQPAGYIEPRDQQTWQFFGPDANHITWRKIYCLDGFNLLASFIYQNDTKGPIDGAVQLTGNLAGVRVQQHAIDRFAGVSVFGPVTLQAFNADRDPAARPVFPVLLQSDIRRCAPGDRLSFTTEWKLASPDDAGP